MGKHPGKEVTAGADIFLGLRHNGWRKYLDYEGQISGGYGILRVYYGEYEAENDILDNRTVLEYHKTIKNYKSNYKQ